MVLNLATKEFSGKYNYTTDSSGIECDYTVRDDGTHYNHPKISSIHSSSPASGTGLEIGDFVISINGHQTEGLPLEQIETLLTNAKSPIILEIERHHLFSNRDSKRFIFDREIHTRNFGVQVSYLIAGESTYQPYATPAQRGYAQQSGSSAANIVAKYTAIIGPKNLANSKGESIIEKMKKNGDSLNDIVKELVLQNRADYYRFGIRYQGDEPSPWFADLGSPNPQQRVNKREAYEALPIVVTPTNWSVRAGTKIDVEITTSEIRAFVH